MEKIYEEAEAHITTATRVKSIATETTD